MMIETKLTFERETKGAVRYQEVDDNGAVIELPWAKIGTLYVRKSVFDRGTAYPRDIVVKIEASGAVESPVFK